jgi:hypothetical protein
MADWRGYILAGFALVWIANVYMSLFAMMRVTTKAGNIEAKIGAAKLEEMPATKSEERV